MCRKGRQAPNKVSAEDPFVYALASNIYQWKVHLMGPIMSHMGHNPHFTVYPPE